MESLKFKIRRPAKRSVKDIYTSQQLAFFEEQKKEFPNTTVCDFKVFENDFSIVNFIDVQNKEEWAQWFYRQLKESRIENKLYTDKIMNILRDKEIHILYECVIHENVPFFSVMLKYLYFMEEKKNQNMKDYVSIHYAVPHKVFNDNTFANFLFSSYNHTTLKEPFIKEFRSIFMVQNYEDFIFF